MGSTKNDRGVSQTPIERQAAQLQVEPAIGTVEFEGDAGPGLGQPGMLQPQAGLGAAQAGACELALTAIQVEIADGLGQARQVQALGPQPQATVTGGGEAEGKLQTGGQPALPFQAAQAQVQDLDCSGRAG